FHGAVRLAAVDPGHPLIRRRPAAYPRRPPATAAPGQPPGVHPARHPRRPAGGARRRAGHLAALPLRPESGMATALPAVAAGPRRRRPADGPGGSAGRTGGGESGSYGVVAQGVVGWVLRGELGGTSTSSSTDCQGVAHLRYA